MNMYKHSNIKIKLVYVGDCGMWPAEMEHYNLTPYKEYEIYIFTEEGESGRCWIYDASDIVPVAIDKRQVEMFFKPLNEVRDEKLNKILK